VEVVGVADRVAHVAGVVAACAARGVVAGGFASGVRVLGDDDSPNITLLREVIDGGVRLREFVGSAID
jgi:hypothetical protein